MREIINKLDFSQVELSKIQDGDFVGIQFGDYKIKVVVKDGVYFGIGIRDTNFNSKWGNGTARGYIEDSLRQNGTKAYLFDSEQDLLEWLLKK